MKHITQSDIAKKLGVSRITVSKALRNHPDISIAMSKRVKEVVAELGYSPNLIAQQLNGSKTFTLGLVVPDLENSFFAYAIDSIIDAAYDKNYQIILTISRENAEKEKMNLEKLISMRVDGLLVCISEFTSNPEIFEHIKKIGIPIIFFDREIAEYSLNSVVFNDKKGAYDAIEEIILSGYTKIAHFAGYSSINIGKERLEGYKSALLDHHIELNNDWIIEGGFEVIDGYKSFKILLNKKQLPQIILTVNDRVAMGAYKAIKESGLNIPDDIGIISFGFHETADTFFPSLTIINQDPRHLGRLAIDLMFEVIDNQDKSNRKRIAIEEKLIWKQSIKRKNLKH